MTQHWTVAVVFSIFVPAPFIAGEDIMFLGRPAVCASISQFTCTSSEWMTIMLIKLIAINH